MKRIAWLSIVLLTSLNGAPCLAQEGFPEQSQYVDQHTGQPAASPNTRQLTDPATGNSTFKGYNIKLTDPVTGNSTFKGYGQDPLMKDRSSAPDFQWNSNVDSNGRSEYSGFGRDPLSTPDGRSTFTGNNRRLVDPSGRPMFVGNNRNLAGHQKPKGDPHYRGVHDDGEDLPGRPIVPWGGMSFNPEDQTTQTQQQGSSSPYNVGNVTGTHDYGGQNSGPYSVKSLLRGPEAAAENEQPHEYRSFGQATDESTNSGNRFGDPGNAAPQESGVVHFPIESAPPAQQFGNQQQYGAEPAGHEQMQEGPQSGF